MAVPTPARWNFNRQRDEAARQIRGLLVRYPRHFLENVKTSDALKGIAKKLWTSTMEMRGRR